MARHCPSEKFQSIARLPSASVTGNSGGHGGLLPVEPDDGNGDGDTVGSRVFMFVRECPGMPAEQLQGLVCRAEVFGRHLALMVLPRLLYHEIDRDFGALLALFRRSVMAIRWPNQSPRKYRQSDTSLGVEYMPSTNRF
jgi:hypothetical protein